MDRLIAPLRATRATRRAALAAAVLALAALGGCASLNTVQTEVTSYSSWPAARAARSYAFERLPSQQQRPQQAQQLEDAARPALERAGFVPAAPGAAPDVTVQLGARLTEIDRSPFDDPFWYGPRFASARPFAVGRYGRPYWGPGWGWGPWGMAGAWDTPYYLREVAVLIRDKQTGEPLYETRAHSDGNWSDSGRMLPALFTAAMKDFPQSVKQSVAVRLDGAAAP